MEFVFDNVHDVNNMANRLTIHTVSLMYFIYGYGQGGPRHTPWTETEIEQANNRNIGNDWPVKVREVDVTENNICYITHERLDNYYCMCGNCHVKYSYGALISWLKINNTCPICRQNWTNKIKYNKPPPQKNMIIEFINYFIEIFLLME